MEDECQNTNNVVYDELNMLYDRLPTGKLKIVLRDFNSK